MCKNAYILVLSLVWYLMSNISNEDSNVMRKNCHENIDELFCHFWKSGVCFPSCCHSLTSDNILFNFQLILLFFLVSFDVNDIHRCIFYGLWKSDEKEIITWWCRGRPWWWHGCLLQCHFVCVEPGEEGIHHFTMASWSSKVMARLFAATTCCLR